MERTSTPQFTLGEVWINQDYVVSVREAVGYKALLREGVLPPDLDNAHTFTTITTQTGQLTETHVVVGAPDTVANRLSKGRSTLLKG